MGRGDHGELLEALEFDPTTAAVYRLLLTRQAEDVRGAARRLGVPEAEVRGALEALTGLGLLDPAVREGLPRPLNPAVGLRELLDRRKRELRRRQESVEHCEAELAELAGVFSRTHSGYAPPATEHLVGLDVVRRRIGDLARNVTEECLTFTPGGAQSPEAHEASRPLDLEALERGVRMRTVYLDSVRNDRATAAYAAWLNEHGGEVRTVPSLPVRMIIFDRTTVLTPLDPRDTRAGAVQVAEPGIVAGLADLFDRVWASASPLGCTRERDDHGLSAQERELLRLLGLGFTDQAAAKRLGISARTVRRMMADLMERLDAHSRFEAGLRAARLAWV